MQLEIRQKRDGETDTALGEWDAVYRENEKFIECGSAYFSQAFAEALGLVSDIELHDVERARLRLGTIPTLLQHAIEQYCTSLDVDTRTGLAEVHEGRLREAGLDYEGNAAFLEAARARGYLVANSHVIEEISVTFSEQGYRALMDRYIRRVRDIHSLASKARTEVEAENPPETTWQDVAWRLSAAFTDAMTFGQAIAIMNSATYR